MNAGGSFCMNAKEYNEWFKVAREHNILPSMLITKQQNTVKGKVGEDKFDSWVKEYTQLDYLILRNIWLSTGGSRVEIDHLILTPEYWIATEVKNYEQDFYYQDGVSKVGKTVIDTNIITRAESARRVLQDIGKVLGYAPNIIFSIAFVNEHCRVHTDYEGPINILMRCDIRDFLYEIRRKTVKDAYYSDPEGIVDYISRYKTHVPFILPDDSELKWDNLKTGVFCHECGSDVEDCYRYYRCLDCSNEEPKKDTVLRAVYNYCTLYRKDEFTVDEIVKFLDGAVSARTVTRYVTEKYPKSGDAKIKYYRFIK